MKKAKEYRLSDRLKEYSNEDLHAYAKELSIKGRSHSKHDEMAEAISAELIKRGTIEQRLQILSDFQIGILKDTE